jgi:hypothetical protein
MRNNRCSETICEVLWWRGKGAAEGLEAQHSEWLDDVVLHGSGRGKSSTCNEVELDRKCQ